MKILALEFSSPQRSVAVLHCRGGAAGTSVSEVVETGPRSMSALSMVESALRETELEREQIQCLVVGLGPGSYNGIRAAIALAQGWQLASAVKLLGIGSADCIAAEARAAAITGRIEVVIDAQRKEFYLAEYDLGAGETREIQSLRIVSMDEVRAKQQSGGMLVGPDVSKFFPEARVIFPRAATLARLALNRTDFIPGEKIEPIYLRQTTFVKAPPPRALL